MSYDQKTHELSTDALEEILSEAEEDLLAAMGEEYEIYEIAERPTPSGFYEISVELLEPIDDLISEAISLSSSSEPSVPGMGIYQINPRKKVSGAVTHAAMRHLRRACRLLRRLEADQALLDDERVVLDEITSFLKRNEFA
jgi:hypothetical protein